MVYYSRLAVVALQALLLAPVAQAEKIALTGINLFNGQDNRIFRDRTVLVDEGLIVAVQKQSSPVPTAFTKVNGHGKYLMPGLFDVHTHLDTLERAHRALESGVTTVRTASVPAYQDVSLRELVRAGELAGPDVVAAGVYVTPNLDDTVLADPRLVPLARGVHTDEQLRLLVDINAERGVDVIKTRGTERAGRADTDPRKQVYTQQQLRVVVEAAAHHGLPVMVHAHGDEGARAAILAGTWCRGWSRPFARA